LQESDEKKHRKMQNTLKTKIRAITRYAAAAVILTSLACLANFISASSGTAKSHDALPVTFSQDSLVEKIVAHRNFFTRFIGYDGDLLCDVNSALGEDKIGLLLLEPVGLLKSLVFDRSALTKLHEDMSILPKKLRDDLSHGAMSISDARLIAKNIAGLRTENMRKSPRLQSTRHETQRREVMPQSLPDGFAPTNDRKADGAREIWEHLRRDVENNPELAAMTSDEILELLRSDVARQKGAK
jgi:hypothetical protein